MNEKIRLVTMRNAYKSHILPEAFRKYVESKKDYLDAVREGHCPYMELYTFMRCKFEYQVRLEDYKEIKRMLKR